MRQRFIGGALLAAAAVFVGPGTGKAQVPVGNDPTAPMYQLPITLQGPSPGGGAGPIITRGQAPGESGPDVPLNSDTVLPIPTGQPGQAGFYTSIEFMTLAQTRTIGSQTIAYRGLVDSTGIITQVPGAYLGSGQKALQTNDKIEIRGFGSFRTRQRRGRTGRNPKTGAKVEVPPKKIPYFKPSKELKDYVNTSARPEGRPAAEPSPQS